MDMFNKQQGGYIIIKQHKDAYFWIINVKNVIHRGHAVKTSSNILKFKAKYS